MDLSARRQAGCLARHHRSRGNPRLEARSPAEGGLPRGGGIQTRICPPDFYAFTKHHFGPFSHDIYRDAEILNHSGCISIRYGEERRDDTFAIVNDCGLESVDLPESLTRYIKESVDWINDMDFPELVRAIYYLYPEYQENSRFAYDEEQSIIESFARGLKQSRAGKSHATADVIAALGEA